MIRSEELKTLYTFMGVCLAFEFIGGLFISLFNFSLIELYGQAIELLIKKIIKTSTTIC